MTNHNPHLIANSLSEISIMIHFKWENIVLWGFSETHQADTRKRWITLGSVFPLKWHLLGVFFRFRLWEKVKSLPCGVSQFSRDIKKTLKCFFFFFVIYIYLSKSYKFDKPNKVHDSQSTCRCSEIKIPNFVFPCWWIKDVPSRVHLWPGKVQVGYFYFAFKALKVHKLFFNCF